MRKQIHFFFLDWSKRPAERDRSEVQDEAQSGRRETFVHHYLRLANFLLKRKLEEQRLGGRDLSGYAS